MTLGFFLLGSVHSACKVVMYVFDLGDLPGVICSFNGLDGHSQSHRLDLK